jgi:D-3-phosphoglycerate dehydrogenase
VYVADTEASERMGLRPLLGGDEAIELTLGSEFAASAQTVTGAIGDADVVCVALGRVSAEAMDAAPKLRLVVKCGIGVDNIDVAAARERGIGVLRMAMVNSDGPAEWVIGAVIAHFRRFAHLDRAVRVGAWGDVRQRWSGLSPALGGRTLGIAGFGSIGRKLARLATAHDMTVLAHDPYVTESDLARMVGREELLSSADVLSLNMVLTDETRHWLSADALSLMKPSAVVANSSRGPVVDEAALYEALRDGRIAGAVLDVFELEPPAPDNPLFGLDQVLLTPHLGGCTDRGYREIGELAAELIRGFAAGVAPPPACVVVPLPD